MPAARLRVFTLSDDNRFGLCRWVGHRWRTRGGSAVFVGRNYYLPAQRFFSLFWRVLDARFSGGFSATLPWLLCARLHQSNDASHVFVLLLFYFFLLSP